MDALTILVVVVVGGGLTSLGFWIDSRLRTGAIESAHAAGRGEGAIELATLKERVSGVELRRDELAQALLAADRSLAESQQQLSTLSQNAARSEARASQLPGLEQALASATASSNSSPQT